jgi:hypothetical protein
VETRPDAIVFWVPLGNWRLDRAKLEGWEDRTFLGFTKTMVSTQPVEPLTPGPFIPADPFIRDCQ